MLRHNVVCSNSDNVLHLIIMAWGSLTAHDEIMVEIEKSSVVESRAAAVMSDASSFPAAASAGTAAVSPSVDALPGQVDIAVRMNWLLG